MSRSLRLTLSTARRGRAYAYEQSTTVAIDKVNSSVFPNIPQDVNSKD
jgi:hypothetical protein